MMNYDVIEALCLRDYVVHLKFADGLEGNIDLGPIIGAGPLFEPHKDMDFFCSIKVSDELGTIYWPNDSDIASDTLYEKIKQANGKIAQI